MRRRPRRGMCAAMYTVNTTCGNLFRLVWFIWFCAEELEPDVQGGDDKIIQSEASEVLTGFIDSHEVIRNVEHFARVQFKTVFSSHCATSEKSKTKWVDCDLKGM